MPKKSQMRDVIVKNENAKILIYTPDSNAEQPHRLHSYFMLDNAYLLT